MDADNAITTDDSPRQRKGKFLWMDSASQRKYLEQLRSKIQKGYFLSESIIEKVVDELAPVFNTTVDRK